MVASLNQSFPVKDLMPNMEQSRLRTVTASATLTAEQHDGQTILIDAAAGLTLTLPAANGTGAKFRFRVKTTVTSNTAVIKVANATDSFLGNALMTADGGNTVNGWEVAANDDTITMDGSTRGGIAGDLIEIEDVASGIFHVLMIGASTGTEATPFSATVS
jgi:hypothetical protein